MERKVFGIDQVDEVVGAVVENDDSSRISLWSGVDDVLFDGNLEEGAVAARLMDVLRSVRLNVDNFSKLLLPGWFNQHLIDYGSADWAPSGSFTSTQAILSQYDRIIAAYDVLHQSGGSDYHEVDLRSLVNEIMRFDHTLFIWVQLLYRHGIEKQCFVERTRWFKGMTPEELEQLVLKYRVTGANLPVQFGSAQVDLSPVVREDVVSTIVGVKQGLEKRGVEVTLDLISGSLRNVLSAVLEEAGVVARLVEGGGSVGLHASTLDLLSDRFLPRGTALHPGRKKRVVESVSPGVTRISFERDFRGNLNAQPSVVGRMSGVVVGV